ncbi:MAG TPA: hypothetical protein VGL15_06380 [Vicinamibacteria bacterium]
MGRGRFFAGVSLLSAAVLMLQLALTRLFSATMHYHFAFLAISLALFGSGAGGVFVYLAGERLDATRTGHWLATGALASAVATALALAVVLHYPISTAAAPSVAVRRLAVVYAASALPFFFAGGTVALAVTRLSSEITRLYLFDLAGAAAGCLLLIPALDRLGAVNTVLAVSAIAAAAAALFAERQRAAYAGVAAGMAALVLANTVTHRLDVRMAKGLVEEGRVLFSKWNSFSRVTVLGRLADPSVLIMLDADAATLLTRDASDPDPAWGFAGRVEALAYRLRPGASALIIGAGGGNDVIMARQYRADPITAVELNPIVARDVMSSEPFRSYSGDLYSQPGVRLIVDEARSFIRRSADRYDVIQGTMVDTWAATTAGAFALAENNLYTVEAFGDYLDHLTDDGLVSMTRWYVEPPDQLLRLVSLARASLEERGVVDASTRVMLIRGVPEEGGARAAATFLLKKSPFTEDETQEVERAAAASGFQVLYTPRARPANAFTRLLEAREAKEVWASLDSNVAPTYDNSPFFFHSLRVRNLLQALPISPEWRKTNLGVFVLIAVMAISIAVTLAFVLGPLALLRGRLLFGETLRKLAFLLYFACLGAAFIVVEVALVQKSILFLGHPVYSLSVVLFSLLLATGIGSRLSGSVTVARLPRLLPLALAGLALLVALYAACLSPVFYALIHLGRGSRIALTVSLLAPLGMAMGAPMPSGIRILAGQAPEIIPWAWGVNGAASVLGSVVALVVAMLAGFNQALLLGAALYALAAVLMRSLASR